jgi:hypothetical protein
VIDLDELNDQVRELAGDQLAVGRRGGVSIVGSLMGYVLDELLLVGLGRIGVDPEGQRAVLGAGALGRELSNDRLDLVLRSVLQPDGEYLDHHDVSFRLGAVARYNGRIRAAVLIGPARSGHDGQFQR